MSQGLVEVCLHPRWRARDVHEGVKQGPIIRTKVKGYKVAVTIVPCITGCGYVGLDASFPVREVARIWGGTGLAMKSIA